MKAMSIKSIFFWFVFIPFGSFGVWMPLILYGYEPGAFCISTGTYICSAIVCSTIEQSLSQFGEIEKKRLLIYTIAIAIAVVLCLFIISYYNQKKIISSSILSLLGILGVYLFWWYQNRNNSAFNEPNNALGGNI